MTISRRLSVLLILASSLAACGPVNDPDQVSHACGVQQTSYSWYLLDLELIHNDSRYCPIDVATGTYVTGGGLVYEGPGSPSSCQGYWGAVSVYDSDGTLQSGHLAFFGNGSYGWQVELTTGWYTGQGWDPGRDYPEFYVTPRNTCQYTNAWAETIVDYWDGQA